MTANQDHPPQAPALLGTLAEQFWRAADRRLRQVIESEVTRITAPVIRGGKLVASALSGVIPLASLPAHKTSHESGGSDALTGSLDATARLQIATDGTLVGTRRRLNLVAGGGIGLSGSDDGANERVTVTITASGGGSAANARTTYAARPAPGVAGRIWLQSDGPYSAFDDGTTWHEYALSFPVKTAGLPDTWVNQGTATADTSRGGLRLVAPTNNGYNSRMLVRALPSPPWTVTALVLNHMTAHLEDAYGIVLRESSTGRLLSLNIDGYDNGRIKLERWNSPSSYNGTVVWQYLLRHDGWIWLRFEDDGTNRRALFSMNGVGWRLLNQQSRTDFLTADQAGLYAMAMSNGQNVEVWLLSWEVA